MTERTLVPAALEQEEELDSSLRPASLAEFVGRVLYEGARPADLVPELMGRRAKPELHGIR